MVRKGKKSRKSRKGLGFSETGGGGGEAGAVSQREDDRERGGRERQKNSATYNSVYEEYYSGQGIFEDQGDCKRFMQAMKEPLPAAIWINGRGGFKEQLRDAVLDLSKDFPVELSGTDKERANVTCVMPTEQLAWVPLKNAFKFGVDRHTIRRVAALQKLKEFLIAEEAAGNITRQEEASMIPPLFLDVRSNHSVLDMCAAPGSKTWQLVELLHTNGGLEESIDIPEGVIIANDSNSKRAYMLSHRLRPSCSTNLLITNHDAQMFPSLERMLDSKTSEQGFFDRVLADVPCSSDGTLRKSKDLWTTWNPKDGLSLHQLQLQIAQRGVSVLRDGGRMVYSTCSLNPIEDEAVVAQLLRQNRGAVELIDVSSELPGLKRRKGLSHWKVAYFKPSYQPLEEKRGEDGKLLDGRPTEKDLCFTENEEDYRLLQKSVFPPTKEEAELMHLDRCMRILPHDQNSSGFFVCVLQKKCRTPRITNTNASLPLTDTSGRALEEANEKKGRKATGSSEAGAVHTSFSSAAKELQQDNQGDKEGLRSDDYHIVPRATVDPVLEHFGIDPAQFDDTQFLCRLGGGEAVNSAASKKRRLDIIRAVEEAQHIPRVISLVSKSGAAILATNRNQKLRIVSAGLQILKKSTKSDDAANAYRFAQSGVKLLSKCMTKRLVSCTLNDIATLSEFANHQSGSAEVKKIIKAFPGTPLKALSVLLQQGATENKGANVLVLEDEDQKRYVSAFGHPLAISCWNAQESMHPMVSKEDLERLNSMLVREKLISPLALDNVDVDALLAQHLGEATKKRAQRKANEFDDMKRK